MKHEATNLLKRLVGAWRFELQTSCAQGRRATRLRYAPTFFVFSFYRSLHICLHGGCGGRPLDGEQKFRMILDVVAQTRNPPAPVTTRPAGEMQSGQANLAERG